MRLLLIRHAQSSANAERRFQGHMDVPLSGQGLRESALLAERLAGLGIHAIYSSPLRRARQTAEVTAERLGLAISERRALIERDVGAISGLTRDEVVERFPEFATVRLDDRGESPIPGFEADGAFEQRVLAVLEEIISGHPGETVAAFTHGGVIGVFCREALCMPSLRPSPFGIDNTSITTFDVLEAEFDTRFRRRVRIVSLNDTCHLDGLRPDAP
jgi:probable phosphoglycerate mutase